MSAGLGLGLGFGLMVAISPVKIQANNEFVSVYQGNFQIERVKSLDLGIDVAVERGESDYLSAFVLDAPAIHLDNSGVIGEGRPIVIQGVNRDFSFQSLTTAQVDDEIFVVGSNGGWYRYRVTEAMIKPIDELPQILDSTDEVLVLMKLNPWQQTADLVLAVLN